MPRKMIWIRKENAWLIDKINDIVEAKRRAGESTTFSFEFVRLARNGLLRNLEGAEEDRRILQDADTEADA